MDQPVTSVLFEVTVPGVGFPAFFRPAMLSFGIFSWFLTMFWLKSSWYFAWGTAGLLWVFLGVVQLVRDYRNRQHLLGPLGALLQLQVDNRGVLYCCVRDRYQACSLVRWSSTGSLVWLRFVGLWQSPCVPVSAGRVGEEEKIWNWARLRFRQSCAEWYGQRRFCDLVLFRHQCDDETWKRMRSWLRWLERGKAPVLEQNNQA